MSLHLQLTSDQFKSASKLGQVHVGMPCRYVGTRRKYGLRGVVVAKNSSCITIKWEGYDEQQAYSITSYIPYVWSHVEFYLQYQPTKQKETQMQTVNLLTINKLLTLEITEWQAKLIKESAEGQALTANDTLVVTKAIKQDGQYFALNPLQVTLPKTSGAGVGPQSLTEIKVLL